MTCLLLDLIVQLAGAGIGLWWYFTYGPGALLASEAAGPSPQPTPSPKQTP